jgi:flavin reductase (DIM6/NTAB) family NADH-FMN oxidoreductase RutF
MTTEKINIGPEGWDRLFAPSSHIAVITTVDTDGHTNAGSYGTCTRVNHDPVYVSFTCGVGTDTYNNVLATGEYVVNLPSFTEENLATVLLAGTHFDPDVSELEFGGITTVPSTKLRPPRVADFGRHFECEVEWTHQWLNRLMVCGKAVAVSCNPEFVDAAGDLVWEKAKPAHYCGAPYHESFVAAYEVMTLPAYVKPE